MSSRIVLAVSTLALGTALTAIPAIAQDNGAGANNAPQYKYPIGRSMNDGGYAAQQAGGAQQTSSAENRSRGIRHPSNAATATGQSTAQNYHYPVGRSMNDGGFRHDERAQYNGGQREERTGSAENIEHAQTRSAALGSSGPENYAYDTYRLGRGPYYDYASGPSYAGGPGPMPGAIEACEARFRSYDPATGTYVGFDGMRHSCP